MRKISVLHLALLALPLTALTTLHAQFQAPTAEELKMTEDPKAPGAAAVILNAEEIDNNSLYWESTYMRIKVLTDKGKELATVQLPYLKGGTKVTELRARTIHPDGTIVPLEGKPEDLLTAKIATKEGDLEEGRKVFTLPSVEVGSILEYYYQIHYPEWLVPDVVWEVQRPYYVHKEHFFYTPFKGFMKGTDYVTGSYVLDRHGNPADTLASWPVLPAGVTVKKDAIGHYSLDITDIPPIPDEEWMPPVSNFSYRVSFYYMNSRTADTFWTDEINYWSKDVDHYAEPTAAIKKAVEGLVAPTDSELDKAKKLYAAVQALDNTDYSRHKGEAERKQLKLKDIKRAEDTWTQKSGNSEAIALLYLAMARAAGLNAKAMKVEDREKGIFSAIFLNTEQLDNHIVILSSGGKDIALDPGEKMCPFGTVNWRHSNANGFLQGTTTVNGKPSPPQNYADNKITQTADLTVDRKGNVEGSLHISLTGQEALRWRQSALMSDEAEVKKSFDRWLAPRVPVGVDAHVDHFLGLKEPGSILMAVVNAKGSLGTATEKRLMLPAFFFETQSKQPFIGQEKRIEPVDMHFGFMHIDQVTYSLPEGVEAEGLPPDAKIPWPQHAVFAVKTVSTPGQIVVSRTLANAFTFAGPDEYQDLRGFYQKVSSSDQQQLVLKFTGGDKAK